ncbi:DUF3795 domain-containing protein [Candidatus Dojkabacteria bacterium]|nr:DUF3795 domain-containing protein [Candidatus Dojkabacteria bacterium]
MANKDEKIIAYCGLCCLDCHGYQQKIPDLARDLRKELRQSKYKKFAAFLSQNSFGKAFKNYDKCYEVLGSMVRFRCHKGCKNGGGPPFCKIRKCCQKKGIEGCWECEVCEKCEKLDYLKPVHDEGHIKNLRRLKKKGTKEFLKGKRDW